LRNCPIIGGKKTGAISACDQQSFHGIADRGILHFGIVSDIDGPLQIRVAVHVNVANAFAMSEHGDAAMLGDVADKFIRSARHDQVDFIVQRQNLRHVFAGVKQDDGIGRNIGEG
jgi:hypothetical protein